MKVLHLLEVGLALAVVGFCIAIAASLSDRPVPTRGPAASPESASSPSPGLRAARG